MISSMLNLFWTYPAQALFVVLMISAVVSSLKRRII
jgi:hypothetical protein